MRFEFYDFLDKGRNIIVEELKEIVIEEEQPQDQVAISDDFAEQNIMSEIGYNIQSNKEIEKVENINIIILFLFLYS